MEVPFPRAQASHLGASLDRAWKRRLVGTLLDEIRHFGVAMRTIRRTTEVDCPFTAVMELTQRCAERLVARRLAAKALRDRSDRARRNTALSVEFLPHSRLPCAPFLVLITARPWHRGCRLQLEASYAPPLGFAGPLYDLVIGRRLAHSAIDGLLRELHAAVEECWRNERAAWTPPLSSPERDGQLTPA